MTLEFVHLSRSLGRAENGGAFAGNQIADITYQSIEHGVVKDYGKLSIDGARLIK